MYYDIHEPFVRAEILAQEFESCAEAIASCFEQRMTAETCLRHLYRTRHIPTGPFPEREEHSCALEILRGVLARELQRRQPYEGGLLALFRTTLPAERLTQFYQMACEPDLRHNLSWLQKDVRDHLETILGHPL